MSGTFTVTNEHGTFTVSAAAVNAVAQDFSGWTYDALLERVNGNAGFGLDYSDCSHVELLVILADMEGEERLALREEGVRVWSPNRVRYLDTGEPPPRFRDRFTDEEWAQRLADDAAVIEDEHSHGEER